MKKYLLILILLLLKLNASTQNDSYYLIDKSLLSKINKVDKLLLDSTITKYYAQKNEGSKIKLLEHVISNFINFDLSISYNNYLLKHCKEILLQPNLPKDKIKIYKTALSGCLNLKINEYTEIGNYTSALNTAEEAIKLLTELNNEEGLSYIYSSISTIYFYMKQENKSLIYAHKALTLEKKNRPVSTHGATYSNIALFHIDLRNYDSAEVYLNKALNIFSDNKDSINLQNVYYNIGIANSYKNNCDTAIYYYKNALKFAIKLEDDKSIAKCNSAFASCYFKTNNVKKGLPYAKTAYEIAKKIKSISIKKETCFNYFRLLKLNKEFDKALFIHEEFVMFNDSLNNVNVRKAVAKKTVELEYAVKEATLKIEQEKEKIITEKEKKEQRIILYSVCGVLILSIFFAFFIFNGLKKQRKANKIISQQKQEVELQKQTVEQQKQKVEEHQKEIIDSINYASRIQRALLPNEKYINKNINKLKR